MWLSLAWVNYIFKNAIDKIVKLNILTYSLYFQVKRASSARKYIEVIAVMDHSIVSF